MVPDSAHNGDFAHDRSLAVCVFFGFDDKFRFDLGWNLDVITDEFKLNWTQVKKLTETLELVIVNEVLAFALALGPTKFVAGPWP